MNSNGNFPFGQESAIPARFPGRRRRIVALLAAASVGLVSVASAQKIAPKLYRIGVLTEGRAGGAPAFLDAMKQALRDHGYIEGQNLAVVHRYAEGKPERLPALAAELVAIRSDVIVAPTDRAIAALKNATQTIPIVMISSGDPVATGFVASLAKPGGNITGMSTMSREIAGKRLELLKEVVPGLARVAMIWNPGYPGALFDFKETETAARTLRVELYSMELRSNDDLERVFASVLKVGAQAVIIPSGNTVARNNLYKIASFAQSNRLPSISGAEFASVGGLMSHGANPIERWQRAANYIDKILKGARPADLPVEQPTRFDLIVNMKTAKALGITIPPLVMVQATKVIE